MAGADAIVASELTVAECERVLIRAWITGAEGADHRAILAAVLRHWTRLAVSDDVLQRALRPFPVEPVRTLDALHLGSALVARAAALRILTLDQHVRKNAERLGLAPLP